MGKKTRNLGKRSHRIEHRAYTILPMMYLSDFKYKRKGLQSIACVESRREIEEKVEIEKRYEDA